MMYFDNNEYYYLDGNTFRVGTLVEQLGSSEPIDRDAEFTYADPSEISLIGEFRISESALGLGNSWEFDAGFQISLNTSNMNTPTFVPCVDPLTDGMKYEIMTTISKDSDGNLTFSSESDGEDHDHSEGMPVYPGSAFAAYTSDGVDIALMYIVQIDNPGVGNGYLIPVSGGGNSGCQISMVACL